MSRAFQRPAAWLLTLSALLTVLAYIWYNLSFLQHQGRYLFTALIPFSIAFAVGWREALIVHRKLVAGVALVGLALAVWGVTVGPGLPRWPLALTAAAAAGLLGLGRLSQALEAQGGWPAALGRLALDTLPALALPLLALYALFGVIVPQLR
jgi:hypothetical protein